MKLHLPSINAEYFSIAVVEESGRSEGNKAMGERKKLTRYRISCNWESLKYTGWGHWLQSQSYQLPLLLVYGPGGTAEITEKLYPSASSSVKWASRYSPLIKELCIKWTIHVQCNREWHTRTHHSLPISCNFYVKKSYYIHGSELRGNQDEKKTQEKKLNDSSYRWKLDTCQFPLERETSLAILFWEKFLTWDLRARNYLWVRTIGNADEGCLWRLPTNLNKISK